MNLTMNKVFDKLRAHNKNNYFLFLFCVTFSIMLITSYVVMLVSDLVMSTLPVGGDSRKQVYFIFAVALIGCFIFTVYAAGLFLKYKSKEMGVFLALGMPKSRLTRALVVEMVRLLSICTVLGLILGGVLSYLIWWLFQLILPYMEKTKYRLSLTGLGIGLLFGVAVMIFAVIRTKDHMKRTNMIDILYEQRKSEPLRPVTKGYLVSGLVFLFLGIILGYIVPQIAGNFGRLLPGIWNATFLFSLLGIYRILTFAIVYNTRGKHPQKYYKNIISYSMMKFQGRQTVRNMCIIVLLLVAGLFAAFYVPMTLSGGSSVKNSPVDFAIHVRASEEELEKEEFYQMAEEYQVTITAYQEFLFAELLGSGVERDWDDNGTLIEEYQERYRFFDFMDVTAYNQLSGNSLEVEDGTFLVVTAPEVAEGFWDRYDDLDLITNPETRDTLSVAFAGTTECQQLINNGPGRYVLSDGDYAAISRGLQGDRQTRQVLFHVAEPEESYAFSLAVYRAFLSRASDAMAVGIYYDEYQEQLTVSAGETYFYGSPIELSEDNPDLMGDWKYYPVIKQLILKMAFQNRAVFFLVFIYVTIICMAAVGIISYTRSITIGLTNKQLFDDLMKLGASHQYIKRSITRQMNKIFVLPTCIGGVLMYAFALLIYWGNDGVFSKVEREGFVGVILIGVTVCFYQYVIYRISLKKIKKVVGIVL